VGGGAERASAKRWATESAEEIAIAGDGASRRLPSRGCEPQHTHSREAQSGRVVNPAIDRISPVRRPARPPLPPQGGGGIRRTGWRVYQPAALPARRDNRQRTAAATPPQRQRLLRRWAQSRHGGERPDEGQRRQRDRRTGYPIQWASRLLAGRRARASANQAPAAVLRDLMTPPAGGRSPRPGGPRPRSITPDLRPGLPTSACRGALSWAPVTPGLLRVVAGRTG